MVKAWDWVRRSNAHIAALIGYVCWSIALTWPMVLHMRTGVIGSNIEDALQNIWNNWWLRWALEHGQNPFWSSMLYYPEGTQMYLQTMNITSVVLALPIHYIAGPVAAYNATLLLAFILTGYGMFLLARTYVPSFFIAWFCGALITAAPFHLMRLDASQANLISIQWFPFYLFALLHLERQPLLRWAIVSTIVLGVLIVLTDWYYGLVAAALTALWLLGGVLTGSVRRPLLARSAGVGAGILLVLSPILWGIYNVRDRLPSIANPVIWSAYVRGYSADALGLFFPSVFHPIWGHTVLPYLNHISQREGPFATEGWYVAAGWMLLLCAGIGLWKHWRSHWRLLVIGVGGWFLSLGPAPRIAGNASPVPSPYTLLEHLPLMSIARRPSLFAVICLCIAGIFAAIGLHWLLQKVSGRWRYALMFCLSLLAVAELQPRFWTTTELQVPAVYQQLRSATPGVVADLPLELAETSRSLHHQIVHENPILGGYVARRPNYESLKYIPLLNQIGEMKAWKEPDIIPLARNALDAMQCAFPIQHIVVQKAYASAEQLSGISEVVQNLAAVQPRFEDAAHIWYELPRFADRCRAFVYLAAGWHPREYDGIEAWRWMEEEGTIGVVNPFDRPIRLGVQIDMASFEHASSVSLSVNQKQIATLNVTKRRYRYTVPITVQPGTAWVQLRSPASYDSKNNRMVSLTVSRIRLIPHL